MTLAVRENLTGWAFLSLNFIGYLLFKLAPLILSGVLSFAKWNFATPITNLKFIGFRLIFLLYFFTFFWKLLTFFGN